MADVPSVAGGNVNYTYASKGIVKDTTLWGNTLVHASCPNNGNNQVCD